jgi:hypothetical protein
MALINLGAIFLCPFFSSLHGNNRIEATEWKRRRRHKPQNTLPLIAAKLLRLAGR